MRKISGTVVVVALGGLLATAAVSQSSAQGLNDIGRALQDQVLGNRGNGDRDRDAYERGRQDQAEQARRDQDARRRADDDRRRFDQDRGRADDDRRRGFEERERRERDFDRQRADRERALADEQRAREQSRRY